jgi:hypothetical protein
MQKIWKSKTILGAVALGQELVLRIGLAIILLTISLQFTNHLQAQTAGGGYAESYLLRNVGARAISMAGAYTAISNDPSAIFYNAAGLGFTEQVPMISTSYSVLEFGRTHSAIAWSQSFEGLEDFGFGLGINNFTTGSFVARDVKGNKLGNVTDWQFAINAAMAYRMEFASFGVNLKYLANSMEGTGVRADGVSMDIGTKFNILDLFSFGMSVQNIGGLMFWNTKANNTDFLLPYTVRTGVAMEFGIDEDAYETRTTSRGDLESVYVPATKYVLISIDAVMTQYENAPEILLGIEAVPHNMLAFRAGLALAGDNLNKYEFFPMTVWGAGFSFRPDWEKLNIDLPFKTKIDYSVSADHLAVSKVAHHISLGFEF